MSIKIQRQPYKLIPYPGKKYLLYSLVIVIIAMILLPILGITFMPSKDMKWHVISLFPLFLLISQLYIFSCEIFEDERVELIRYKTIFSALNIGFIIFMAQVYQYLADSESDFFFSTCYSIFFTQMYYIFQFRKNLKKDPEWIYSNIKNENFTSFAKFRYLIAVPFIVSIYYLAIYFLSVYL